MHARGCDRAVLVLVCCCSLAVASCNGQGTCHSPPRRALYLSDGKSSQPRLYEVRVLSMPNVLFVSHSSVILGLGAIESLRLLYFEYKMSSECPPNYAAATILLMEPATSAGAGVKRKANGVEPPNKKRTSRD